MNEPEKFLDRWSRRKREAADEPKPDSPALVEAKDIAAPAPPAPAAKDAAGEVPFDPASLPPIESITEQSDIRAFLKPGVPPDLARAALRRAWSADPAIRDFIGLVENGWDFNDPHGVPGFGPMPVGENIGRLLAQAIGGPSPAAAVPPQPSTATHANSEQNPSQAVGLEPTQQLPPDQPAPAQDVAQLENDSVRRNEGDVASQNDSDDREKLPRSRRRGHGGALPK
jgi:Protein of unknown function (DUF3306)